MGNDRRGRKETVALVVSDPEMAASLQYLTAALLEAAPQVLTRCTELHMDALDTQKPRLLILDCPATPQEMIDLIARARACACPPQVLVLDHTHDGTLAVAAFRAGASDVIRAPFTLEEFACRLRARLDGTLPWRSNPDLGGRADWQAEAFIARQAQLTTAEAQVLRVLLARLGAIVTRDDLSQALDGRPWSYGDRKFDVHVAAIRRKLDNALGDQLYLETIRSVGYRLMRTGDVAPAAGKAAPDRHGRHNASSVSL